MVATIVADEYWNIAFVGKRHQRLPFFNRGCNRFFDQRHDRMLNTISANGGMLLAYPRSRELRIWMKNMLIPLDIVFLDHQGRVVNLVERVPPCRQLDCPIYDSAESARYALEITAGSARKLGIARGQRLVINPVAGVGAVPSK